jgi:hypothetical protein
MDEESNTILFLFPLLQVALSQTQQLKLNTDWKFQKAILAYKVILMI